LDYFEEQPKMIPNSDALNWVIGPVTRAIAYVGAETMIAGTLLRSLTVLEGHEVFLRLAREKFAEAGAEEGLPKIDELLAQAPALSRGAAELRENDYSVVNGHSMVGIWSAIEVAVEDTVVLILSKEASALSMVVNAGVKTASFEPGPVSEEDARRLFSRLERQPHGDLKIGEFYVHLLGIFGIRLNCSRHTLSKLEEINNVRNSILHRGGIIDDRAAQSGSLRPFLGKQFPVTQARYLEYFDAIGDFLKEMLNGVIASGYIRTAPGAEGGAGGT
jgi:hypothetical protein